VPEFAAFAAGMLLRMFEQVSGGMVRSYTGTVYDLLCMECVWRGGGADAYLVQLTNISTSTDPKEVAATVAAARQHTPAAARKNAVVPTPRLQVGGLYVLKVCRPLQSLTGEQPSRAAARKFIHEAASNLHNEHKCFLSLQGCPYVVHCFGYGSSAAAVPLAAAAPPAAAAAEAGPGAVGPTAAAAAAGEERPCLLLEYGQGGTVKTLLQPAVGQQAGMTEEEAKCVIQHVGLALQDCNSERIVYRDLHPGNIVFNMTASGQHCYKLADFGAVHMMVHGLGRGALFGVPHYRLPEQLDGAYHHDTLDTGKLGLLLLELRTGERGGVAMHAGACRCLCLCFRQCACVCCCQRTLIASSQPPLLFTLWTLDR
jgi:serine/threonine protein kinase